MLGILGGRRTLIIILGMTLLGLSLPLYLTYDYIENDPKFCISCHLMQKPFEAWQVSAMHTVSCRSCHQQSPVDSLNLVYQAVIVNPQEITKHAEVPVKNCLSCHGSDDPQWIQVSKEVGHRVHYINNNISCLQCHGQELHVFKPTEELCNKCHEETVRIPEMKIKCLACHQYTAKDEEELIPGRPECAACHTGKATVTLAVPEKAHAASACSDCHKPHTQEKPLACTSCHDQPLEGLHQAKYHTEKYTSCTTCHAPHVTEDAGNVRNICTICHMNKVEHNAPIECNVCHSFK